jgi:NTP pyrophosphatase (non-canonical NTP hydrolase)
MSELQEIMEKIISFRDERDWKQFHNPKDLAMCLNIEASELLELFLWKQEQEVNTEKLKDELADVLYSAFLLAHHYQIDIKEVIQNKLDKNAAKYPVAKAKGSNKKYNDL